MKRENMNYKVVYIMSNADLTLYVHTCLWTLQLTMMESVLCDSVQVWFYVNSIKQVALLRLCLSDGSRLCICGGDRIVRVLDPSAKLEIISKTAPEIL